MKGRPTFVEPETAQPTAESVEPVPFQRQPGQNRFFWFLGWLFFRIMGWKVKGAVPNEPKMVIAAGPHTSNMDGVFVVFGIWYLRIRGDWMVKKELTRWPLGFFVRRLGGMPTRSLGMWPVKHA